MALRDLVLRFMSADRRAAAEAESRRWLGTRTACGTPTPSDRS